MSKYPKNKKKTLRIAYFNSAFQPFKFMRENYSQDILSALLGK